MYLAAEAETLSRVCDLVEEARWRYDLRRVSFMESVYTHEHLGSFLMSLWIMGEDDGGWWMVTSTRDIRSNGVLVQARIDSGNSVLEGRNLGELLMVSRNKRWNDESVYDKVVCLAQQDSLRKGVL